MTGAQLLLPISTHERKGDLPIKADEVVKEDLRYICENLADVFSAMSGRNVLLTGGAGFLGYYLVQSILHWNRLSNLRSRISLTVYDNYVRGVPQWLMGKSEDPSLSLVHHDVTKPLPANLPDYHYIIHAASIASPTYYRRHPIETMDANVNGLRFLLDYFRALQQKSRNAAGFLFFSSSEIYGDPSPGNIPTPESYRGYVSCTGPRACYDEAKRYGETLCVNFAQQFELPIVMVRPFNNYGPGLKITDRRALPDFANDVFSGRDIVLLSDGSPRRTFCYVADAVIGYYKALVRGHSGEAYNIGVESPEISVAELAERVVNLARELFGYQGKVVRHPSQDKDYLVDNPHRRCPDITKARQELGFTPMISVEEGLKRSLCWYAGHQTAEEA